MYISPKNRSRLLACFILLLISVTAQAGPSVTGTWKQSESTAGDCPKCTITIRQVTDHIIRIKSSNLWTGFAF